MSRGPGHVERTIRAALAAEPDNAFTTDELCELVYPDSEFTEKKHCVAVLRAAKKLCAQGEAERWCWGASRGNPVVFYTPYRVLSYAMARLKGGRFFFTDSPWEDEEALRARLAPGGRNHDLVVEGGMWWRHIEIQKAERDGDTARVATLQSAQDADSAATVARIRTALAAVNETCVR